MKRLSIFLVFAMLIAGLGTIGVFADETTGAALGTSGDAAAAATSAAVTFSDVVGTPYEDAVTSMCEKGVINGYEDGTFKPEGSITRAEACKVVVLTMTDDASAKAAGKSGFSDMEGASWAEPYVAYAVQKGVITGYEDGTFRPSNNVSYAEMSAMIIRAAGVESSSLTGSWPLNYVNAAEFAGIFTGITADKSAAEWYSSKANRGNVTIMVNNAYNLIAAAVEAASQTQDAKTETTDNSSSASSSATVNTGGEAGYKGKLADYSGRAYGMINSLAEIVDTKGDKVTQVDFVFGKENLQMNARSKISMPAGCDNLNGDVYALVLSGGDVKEILAAKGSSEYVKVITDPAENPSLVLTSNYKFAQVQSFKEDCIELVTDDGSEVATNVVEEPSIYTCCIEGGKISEYEVGKKSDIKAGAYVKCFSVLKTDAGMTDIVVVAYEEYGPVL